MYADRRNPAEREKLMIQVRRGYWRAVPEKMRWDPDYNEEEFFFERSNNTSTLETGRKEGYFCLK